MDADFLPDAKLCSAITLFERASKVPGFFNADDALHFALVLGMQNATGPAGDILEIVVAGILIMVARGVAAGDLRSRNTAVILAAISAIFSLFALPYGLVPLLVSVAVMLLLYTQSAKSYFGV
mgnify:CR=1 FL=1